MWMWIGMGKWGKDGVRRLAGRRGRRGFVRVGGVVFLGFGSSCCDFVGRDYCGSVVWVTARDAPR
jgi:hypothetical protein